jgi:hypothetical protein
MGKIFQINKPVGLMTIFGSGDIDYRNIKEDGSVGPSKPIYEETSKYIFENIKADKSQNRRKQVRGFIPEKLMFMDNEQDIYIWKHKAKVRDLYHTKDDVSGKYALPHLVFKLIREKLYVVAVKKFTPKADCYVAPFVNIYQAGSVCMGSAKIKYKSFTDVEELIDHAENVFFNSKFSHTGTDYMELGKNEKVFPIKQLEPYHKLTLKKFLKYV